MSDVWTTVAAWIGLHPILDRMLGIAASTVAVLVGLLCIAGTLFALLWVLRLLWGWREFVTREIPAGESVKIANTEFKFAQTLGSQWNGMVELVDLLAEGVVDVREELEELRALVDSPLEGTDQGTLPYKKAKGLPPASAGPVDEPSSEED